MGGGGTGEPLWRLSPVKLFLCFPSFFVVAFFLCCIGIKNGSLLVGVMIICCVGGWYVIHVRSPFFLRVSRARICLRRCWWRVMALCNDESTLDCSQAMDGVQQSHVMAASAVTMEIHDPIALWVS